VRLFCLRTAPPPKTGRRRRPTAKADGEGPRRRANGEGHPLCVWGMLHLALCQHAARVKRHPAGAESKRTLHRGTANPPLQSFEQPIHADASAREAARQTGFGSSWFGATCSMAHDSTARHHVARHAIARVSARALGSSPRAVGLGERQRWWSTRVLRRGRRSVGSVEDCRARERSWCRCGSG
jgi:hypothetical protein